MRIYKMTATFGKLEHQTLTLEPGLNVITAPNEWGKSTWCAFLVAMLYGLDTRAKTTKTALADKERYAPWSGSPMAGRIDLNWKGRDITIERSTKRRVPLGEFRAYETVTGLPVAELTAANCGQQLLGVEQTVFRRAGFIRHAELPVTQDEALRRRLNALVTTGDESGAADALAEKLKELKNRCRFNRTGLIPQAEAQRAGLEDKLTELENLEDQSAKLKERVKELGQMNAQLKNHQQALAYAKAQADAARVEQAKAVWDVSREELAVREEACRQLSGKETADRKSKEIKALMNAWRETEQASAALPREPQQPQMLPPFVGMDVEEATETVKKDIAAFQAASSSKISGVLIVVGILGLLAAAALVFLKTYLFAGIAGGMGLFAVLWGIMDKGAQKRQLNFLLDKYGTNNYKRWPLPIRDYEREMERYRVVLREYQDMVGKIEARFAALNQRRQEVCGDQEFRAALESWEQTAAKWDALAAAQSQEAQANRHYHDLKGMLKPAQKPAMEDRLTQSEGETLRLIAECTAEEQRLQNRLGQYQGRMETLGDAAALRKNLDRQNRRIAKLEDTYAALTLALETLTAAREELQRRFAPRITQRAQKLLARMTGGRYSHMTMGADFSLQARAGEEDVLQGAIWRSDGTLDQLYLALRLAVAEELTPNAPLILDDALVRFDDQRLKATVEVLRESAQNKQIICFTCQGREAKA